VFDNKALIKDKIARILAENSVLTLATGEGDGLWAATMYYMEDGDDLYCVVKPGARTLENLKTTPRAAVTVDGGVHGRFLQATGRIVAMGPVDDEAELRERIVARNPRVAPFLEKIPGCQLLKIVVERYHVTDHTEGPAPREDFTTEAGAAKIAFLPLWGRAVRSFSFTASLIPPLVGAMLVFMHEAPAKWALLPLILLASVAYHAGTNLVNDYYDFKNNVDRRGTLGSSGLLVQGLIPAKSILRGAVFFFALGTAIGFYFIAVRGLPIFALGLFGLLGGVFYTAGPVSYKYKAIGEPMVFLLMGPLMVVGSYLVLTGSFRWDVVFVSLPVGCLVAAILQSNDLRDIAYDRTVGVKTAAIVFGRKVAGVVYHALVVSAYAIVGILAALDIVPIWSLAVLLTTPIAIKNMKIAGKIAGGGGAAAKQHAMIDVMTAQLHMAFGVLLILSLAAGRLL
jgi:1,4-dihydroxy-2-naphthoate octaprenyltransferase